MHIHGYRSFPTQAQAYFKALPANKTPVRGTLGERYRQKQLIKQIPAHDVDVFYCNDISEEEKRQMELFVQKRREKVLGRGEIKQKETEDASSMWVSWVSCNLVPWLPIQRSVWFLGR